jgi:hypothetical protein
MPKLSDSIEIDGRYYCWDENTDKVYEVDLNFYQGDSSEENAIKTLIKKKRKLPRQQE